MDGGNGSETETRRVNGEDDEQSVPERLQRAEGVLQFRTGRIILVLEQCMDAHNHQAVLRTAEALGIQHVWLVSPNEQQVKLQQKRKGVKKITRNCTLWLSIREFSRISDCIDALQTLGCEIWATDLSPDALPMTSANRPQQLPPKLALVIGRETDGVSAKMLAAATRRVYLPIVGFSESLNLSVATALVLQRLLDWYPEVRGDLSPDERQDLRAQWYPQLVKSPEQAQYWLAHTSFITAIDDLRRPKLEYAATWIPKRVRAREEQLEQVQERDEKRIQRAAS